MKSDLFIFIENLVEKHGYHAYTIIAKRNDLEEIRQEIIEATNFLTNTNWKERCGYILQNRNTPNLCKCGCGTSIKLENIFVKNHSHRDPEIKSKWQENLTNTLIDRYGNDFGKMRLERAQKTNMEKYGVLCTFQLEDVKQKITETILDRLGVDNCSKDNRVKQKKKDTYEKNYGTEFNQSLVINDKIRQSRYKNTFDRFDRFSDQIIPLFNLKDFTGGGYDKIYPWLCKKCGTEFSQYYWNGQMPRCPSCFPTKFSMPQNEISEFLSSIYKGEIIDNDRQAIQPLEIDIFIPELSLGIEFDGLYWHSEQNGKDRNFHLNKTELCKERGINLIHIFEDEWRHKKEIVKSKLANLVKANSAKIFARKCKIVEISHIEKSQFLIENHIQGDDRSAIYFGLRYEDKLVAVMTFGKSRFNSKFEFELMRFTTLLNHNVIGGGNKLFNHFVKNFKPTSVISYADRRWTINESNLYQKLGFSFSHTAKPNYFYVKGAKRETRLKYQKHKLEKLLETYNSKLSERENMEAAGFLRIWDCGNFVYTRTFLKMGESFG